MLACALWGGPVSTLEPEHWGGVAPTHPGPGEHSRGLGGFQRPGKTYKHGRWSSGCQRLEEIERDYCIHLVNIIKALTCTLKQKMDLALHMMFGTGMATSEHVSRHN